MDFLVPKKSPPPTAAKSHYLVKVFISDQNFLEDRATQKENFHTSLSARFLLRKISRAFDESVLLNYPKLKRSGTRIMS